MKGLVLKDLYSIRHQIIISMFLLLLPNLILMFMGGGMFVYAGAFNFAGIVMYGIVGYCSIMLLTSFTMNTLEADTNSGWTKYQRTMPVTGGQIIGGKLLATVIVVAIMAGITLIFNLIAVIIFEMPPEPMIAMPLCFACMQITALSPSFPLSMKIGSKFTTAIYLGFEIIVAILMIVFAFGAFGGDFSPLTIRLCLYGGLPLLTAGVLALSYLTGRKACLADI